MGRLIGPSGALAVIPAHIARWIGSRVAAIAELERELSPYEAGLADYELTFPVPDDEDF
jgi:uncharacterized protein YaiL (DUF2058 family)